MGKDLRGKELGKGLRQNKTGKFEARYVDRFGKRKSLYSDSRIEIKDLLRKALAENELKLNIVERCTLDEWYEKWLEIYKIPVIRLNTKRHYETVYRLHILPYIGSLYLDEIKPANVKALINQLDNKGLQWETQNKVRILLTDMFDRAMENELLMKNPARGVRLAKNKPQERVVLSVEEQKNFLECSAGTFYDNLFVLQLTSGLRSGEACALEESDLDFENKIIHVTKTLLYQKLDGDIKKEFHIELPKTATSMREVPMSNACEIALKKQLKLKKVVSDRNIKTTQYPNLLFVTKYNTPINSVILNEAISRIVDEINLQRDSLEKFPQFSSHTFRHTFATRCLEAGIQPKTISKYLGHASLQMTMDLYVHVDEAYKMSEMEKFNSAMVMPEREISVIKESEVSGEK